MTLYKRILFFLIFITFLNCTSVKKVYFKNYIDTTNKPIELQTKQTFELKSLGVSASNQFDGARLNGFEKLNDSSAVAIIKPENTPINNSTYYAFKIWSQKPKPIYLYFKYLKGFKHRYIPKLKINEQWSILDSSNISTKDSTTFIKLNLKETPQIVAAQKIESSKDVRVWFNEIIASYPNIVKYESVGKSHLERDLPVLIINKKTKSKKNIIVLLTRQHPPEVTGYYAFKYFVETILNSSALSDKFLDNHQIIAFPIMNPDGVDLGNWRHNAGGVDTNRDWSKYHQPEIKQAVTFIAKYAKEHRSKVVLGLDFHSTWYDIFYTNKKRKGTTLPYFIDNWFAGIEKNVPDYKIKEAAKNSTKPVSKGWFLNYFDAVGITFEIGDKTLDKEIRKLSETAALQMMQILSVKK